MYITWNHERHTFVVADREYVLGGPKAVYVPDADAAHIFLTRKWGEAVAARLAVVTTDAQHNAPAHEPMLSKEEHLKRKAAAAAKPPKAAPPSPVEEG
jgi:hypothetical protein